MQLINEMFFTRCNFPVIIYCGLMQINTQVLFTNYSVGVTMTICDVHANADTKLFKFINTLKPEDFSGHV